MEPWKDRYKPTKADPRRTAPTKMAEPIFGQKPPSTSPSSIINLYFYVSLPLIFVGLDWVYKIYFFFFFLSKCYYWRFVSFLLLFSLEAFQDVFLPLQLTFSWNKSIDKITLQYILGYLHLIPLILGDLNGGTIMCGFFLRP